ncbi:DUF3887 domain-containing protein [bacterium]|nr:DUF3887 domain-containing protein [bacterium]MCI0607179.1 DUF3887 domain-containing protein [bacterium]
MRGKIVCLFLLVLFVSCSGSKGGSKKVDEKYRPLIEQFANSIVQKDYQSAYNLTSPALQKLLTYQEFVENWSGYREGFSGLKVDYRPGDNPQEKAEFVPEADRASLVAEITLAFSGVLEGEQTEFFCTTWIVDDGTPYISSFYIED